MLSYAKPQTILQNTARKLIVTITSSLKLEVDDVFAPSDLSERILKKSLKLIQQGNESYEGQEWTTYEFLLGTHAGAKDYDNYLKTVNEMMARFPNTSRMAELENYKQQAEDLIEKRDQKVMQSE